MKRYRKKLGEVISMDDHEQRREPDHKGMRKPLRKHPKPAMTAPSTLNQAIRQELWYVDTMVASPFRIARRQLQNRHNAWAEGADEAIWALEGMVRLPLKLAQSAFGEKLGASAQKPGGIDRLP